MYVIDERVRLQVRIVLNKWSENKQSINTQFAQIITEFSHSTCVERSHIFQCNSPLRYFCVNKVHSPFWVTAVEIPSRVAFFQTNDMVGTDFGRLHFVPDWLNAGVFQKKRLFNPWTVPFIKCRNKKYYLKKASHR
jgi:hypothetical protein